MVEIDTEAFEKSLAEYLQKACREIAERLAEIGAEAARMAYGSAVHVAVNQSHSKQRYVIRAFGEAVCFLEFGTGVLTDTAHPFAGNVSFKVEPGSWSETHARTYQHWVQNGKQGEYPYNTRPLRGMYECYKAIKKYANQVASDVLSGN